jgi:glycosyltransferase involved in cell wall biosynthesis
MKVVHVVPTFYPATYWGGPIYSVYGLCNALVKIPGVSLKVLTTDAASHSRSDSVHVSGFPMHYPEGYEVYFCHRLWGASFSPSMLLKLWPMIRWADVVHLTAMYSPPTIPTLLICRLLGKPVVWSPRGALQRWDGSTKPLVKGVWERICNTLIKPGRCFFHVTSEVEATASVERMPKAIAKLIPNGVDVPEGLPDKTWLPDGKLRLLYIGRIHPKKGIENLLQAIKILDDESTTLAIYGSGDDVYTHSLHQLVCKLGLEQSVKFYGHVVGKEKMKAFMQADLCVVPSFTENFGMVIAEALVHGVPVIASKGTPWQEIESRGCGLWIENTPGTIAEAICNLDRDLLSVMGFQGRSWIKNEFTWPVIGRQLYNLYESIIKEDHNVFK